MRNFRAPRGVEVGGDNLNNGESNDNQDFRLQLFELFPGFSLTALQTLW
jgi:hypothetical protein